MGASCLVFFNIIIIIIIITIIIIIIIISTTFIIIDTWFCNTCKKNTRLQELCSQLSMGAYIYAHTSDNDKDNMKYLADSSLISGLCWKTE